MNRITDVSQARFPSVKVPIDNSDLGLIPPNILATKSIYGIAGTATADATAGAGDIANGKSAYVNGAKVTGTGANAKLYASGSGGTTTSTTLSYSLADGSNFSFFSAIVSGLNFPNGIAQINVIITQLNGSQIFYNHNNIDPSRTGNILTSTNNVSKEVQLIGNASVTTTSFQLPTTLSAAAFTWEAWGS